MRKIADRINRWMDENRYSNTYILVMAVLANATIYGLFFIFCRITQIDNPFGL